MAFYFPKTKIIFIILEIKKLRFKCYCNSSKENRLRNMNKFIYLLLENNNIIKKYFNNKQILPGRIINKESIFAVLKIIGLIIDLSFEAV